MAEITRRTLLSRTAVLAGLAVGAGLGFTKGIRHPVAEPPQPAPTALTDALSRQQRLLAGYLAVGSDPARPALAALRADVNAHGDALRALLDRYPGWRLAQSATGSPQSSATGSSGTSASPGTSASTSPAATSVTGLAAASTADARALSDAVLGWPAAEQHAGEVLPVLASIAACLTSHARVLA